MEKRFIAPILVTLLIIVYALAFLFIIPLSGELIPLIPGEALSDYLISLLIPLGIIILMCFIGHYIVKVLIPIHKALKLNRYDYFIVHTEKKLTSSRIIIRAFYPGLFAINIAIYISLYGRFNNLFLANAEEQGLPALIEWIAILVGIPIAALIIAPIWMLESSGLMCSLNQEKYKNRVSPDIESVARFYSTLFKGYVGISTITTYILILYTFADEGVTLDNYFILFIDPFAIMLFFVPLSLLLEARFDSINKRLIPYFEKMGINIVPQGIRISPKQ